MTTSFTRSNRPAGVRGQRAYAIGDVHGRLDLLDALLDEIEKEIDRTGAKKSVLIFVGDLIDRGPSSAGVIERLRTYRHSGVQRIFLLGNHEEVLLRILAGDAKLISNWLRFGGAQCLESYGVDLRKLVKIPPAELVRVIREAIPPSHVQFLQGFVDSCRFGDYLFVHAGIRPGVALAQQLQSDLRWIRDPFLLDETDHGFVVVHGHTITKAVEEKPNRIGIDTGAYRTGVLSAVAIENDRRWFIDTRVPS